jgi:hypothetical protein
VFCRWQKPTHSTSPAYFPVHRSKSPPTRIIQTDSSSNQKKSLRSLK